MAAVTAAMEERSPKSGVWGTSAGLGFESERSGIALPLEADQSLGLKTRAAIVERMAQVQGWGLGDEHWAWVSSQSTAGWPHWRLTSLLGLVAAVTVTMAKSRWPRCH